MSLSNVTQSGLVFSIRMSQKLSYYTDKMQDLCRFRTRDPTSVGCATPSSIKVPSLTLARTMARFVWQSYGHYLQYMYGGQSSESTMCSVQCSSLIIKHMIIYSCKTCLACFSNYLYLSPAPNECLLMSLFRLSLSLFLFAFSFLITQLLFICAVCDLHPVNCYQRVR